VFKPFYDKALRQFSSPRTLQKQSQNKPNSKPIKPNLRKDKMKLNLYLTKDYENEQCFRPPAKQIQFQTQFLTGLTEPINTCF